MTFSSVDDRVTFDNSKTSDPDLDKFISKLGLGSTAADKFARNNSVKINDEKDKQETDTNENITNKNKNTTNIPSCNL